MDHGKILKAFNKFAGREVAVKPLPHMGIFHQYEVDQTQDIVKELRATAKEMGVQLNIVMPDSNATRDFVADRLNIPVKKESDGKWRIQNDITLA